ncbi:hypothetical protein B0H63DRAFT_519621 [Podospora didyma]|uniref:Uncharacterized protein n=1 Tax=Podospora didyma TaxID=330526 RepID=A0AAE0U4A2_9PEZI|nr:hypothetical protein B0H63DRAFT_519621 [Podospora didyma]
MAFIFPNLDATGKMYQKTYPNLPSSSRLGDHVAVKKPSRDNARILTTSVSQHPRTTQTQSSSAKLLQQPHNSPGNQQPEATRDMSVAHINPTGENAQGHPSSTVPSELQPAPPTAAHQPVSDPRATVTRSEDEPDHGFGGLTGQRLMRPRLRVDMVHIETPSTKWWKEGIHHKDVSYLFTFPPASMHEDYIQYQEFWEEEFAAPTKYGFDTAVVDTFVHSFSCESGDYLAPMEKEQETRRLLFQKLLNNKQALKDLESQRMFLSMSLKHHDPAKRADASQKEDLQALDNQIEATEEASKRTWKRIKHLMIQAGKYTAETLKWDFDYAETSADIRKAERKKKEREEERKTLNQMIVRMVRRDDEKEKSRTGRPLNPRTVEDKPQPKENNPGRALNVPPPVWNRQRPLLEDHEPEVLGTPTLKDTIKVPNWFAVLEARGVVKLNASGQQARYDELITTLAVCSQKMQNTEQAPKKPFNKQWHEPNPDWPFQDRREKGGWWMCRTGPDATKAEKACKACYAARREASMKLKVAPPSAAEKYAIITAEIDKAMALTVKHDKNAVKAMFAV